MTNSTYTPSVHLFVDMDGTLVTWKQAACFEELLQENYFRDLPPYKEVVDAINWLNSTYPEIDVHILSPTIYLWVAPRHPAVLLSNLLPKL